MTCKLYSADDRALIVDLLTRYDEEAETVASLRNDQGLETASVALTIAGVGHILKVSEICEVYERRMESIKTQLAKKGVELAESKSMLSTIAHASELPRVPSDAATSVPPTLVTSI